MKTEPDGGATPETQEAAKEAQHGANSLHLKEASGAVVGALGGAGLGVLAGPPGIAAGAVIGAVAGTLTSWAMATDHSEADEERELDEEIGVTGGEVGVESLQHPPVERGAFSAAAAGAANVAPDDSISAEGPIAPPPGGG